MLLHDSLYTLLLKQKMWCWPIHTCMSIIAFIFLRVSVRLATMHADICMIFVDAYVPEIFLLFVCVTSMCLYI